MFGNLQNYECGQALKNWSRNRIRSPFCMQDVSLWLPVGFACFALIWHKGPSWCDLEAVVQARRSFRALKGLVRLQAVVRGQNVKRQTMNAMKYMQLLVRVQSQIQSRRIQMLENQARYQAEYKNDKEVGSNLGKLTLGHAVSLQLSQWIFPYLSSMHACIQQLGLTPQILE